MNSSTDIRDKIEVALKGEAAVLVRDGEGVEMIVPPDLAVTTRATGDLVRCRGIRRVTNLLRIVLAYAMCDWSLRLVGAWCVLIEMADGVHLVRRWPCLALDQLAVGHLARRAHPRPVPHPLAGRSTFKRFKGLLHLDGLRAQDPRLAQTSLLGKLLGAVLLDELTQASTACVPDWFTSLERPVSPWRLTACWYDQLRNLVRGQISLAQLLDRLPRLQRFLCDSPGSAPNNWLGREPSCSVCLFV